MIRIDHPYPNEEIQIPSPERTNHMRNEVFHSGWLLNSRKLPDGEPLMLVGKLLAMDCHPERALTDEELEAISNVIRDEPLDANIRKKTYTVYKHRKGRITLEWDQAPDAGNEEASFRSYDLLKPHGAGREEEATRQNLESAAQNQFEGSRLGNDPQTSDQAPTSMGREDEKIVYCGLARLANNLETIVERKEDLIELEGNCVNEPSNAEHIKDDSPENSLPTNKQEPDAQLIAKTDSLPPGQFPSLNALEPIVTPRDQQPRSLRDRSEGITPTRMPGKSREVANEQPADVRLPVDLPPRDDRMSALLAAAHLVQLPPEFGYPREVSYFAFNATLVGGKPGKPPFVRKGHAFVHLYDSNFSDNDVRTPFDHQEEEDRVREHLADYEGVGTDLILEQHAPSDDPVARWHPLDPHIPPFIPCVANISNEDGQPLTMDQAIQKLRLIPNEVEDPIYNPPNSPVWDRKDPGPMDLLTITDSLNDLGATGRNPLESAIPTSSNAIPVKTEGDCLSRPRCPIKQVHFAQLSSDTATTPPTSNPPTLYYPSDLECEKDVVEETYPRKSDHHDRQPPPGPEEKNPLIGFGVMDPAKKEKLTKEVAKAIRRARDDINCLGAEIDRLLFEEGIGPLHCLAELGILQVTYDIGEEKDAGREPDHDHWKARIAAALEEADRRANPTPIQTDNEVQKDVVMTTHDDNKTRSLPTYTRDARAPSPVDWYPDVTVPDYVPSSPGPDPPDNPYVPRSPDPTAIDDIRYRVSGLEDRLETASLEWKERLREIETQIFTDACLLTELQWESAELKKISNQSKAKGKKNRRGNHQDCPGHRYPTRYQLGQSEKKINETKKDVGRMAERVRKIEGRMEEAKGDIARIEIKLGTLADLTPRLEGLARDIEQHQRDQIMTHLDIYHELTTLRNAIGPGLDAKLREQSNELATLRQQCQYLYAVALSLMFPNASDPPKTQPTTNPYPTPASSPVVPAV
jgi:hypothetical protein